METKFNFNSQIATNKAQSEKLLSLGLKKETADMFYDYCRDRIGYTWFLVPRPATLGDKRSIPAWSLDRLKELYKCVGDTSLWNLDDVNYDRLIQCIGIAIKHNDFNKDYLV